MCHYGNLAGFLFALVMMYSQVTRGFEISPPPRRMNPFVSEYRSLPPSSDHLPDTGPNHRKCRILQQLDDDQANEPEVSGLLLEILRDPREFDLARVEAIKAVGICVKDDNPLAEQLWAALHQIAASDEDEMLQGWAGRYIDLREKP